MKGDTRTAPPPASPTTTSPLATRKSSARNICTANAAGDASTITSPATGSRNRTFLPWCTSTLHRASCASGRVRATSFFNSLSIPKREANFMKFLNRFSRNTRTEKHVPRFPGALPNSPGLGAPVNPVLASGIDASGQAGPVFAQGAQGAFGLQATDTVLTSAQLLALLGTPITLVPAPA